MNSIKRETVEAILTQTHEYFVAERAAVSLLGEIGGDVRYVAELNRFGGVQVKFFVKATDGTAGFALDTIAQTAKFGMEVYFVQSEGYMGRDDLLKLSSRFSGGSPFGILKIYCAQWSRGQAPVDHGCACGRGAW